MVGDREIGTRLDQPSWNAWFMAWANREIDRELGEDYARRRPRGTTYVVQCQETLRVKIGQSRWPDVRLRSLRVGSPTPLDLIALLDVDELWAHDDLREHRLHGEWFAWGPFVEAYIAAHRVAGGAA